MWAILSDVHGNLEALTAVLADIDRHPVERVFCLGNTVGYGPDPVACLDLVRQRCDMALMGDHDFTAMFDPEGYVPSDLPSIIYTKAQLERGPDNEATRQWRWQFLADLPRTHREGPRLFLHGSARNPVYEYVFPEDIYNQHKMQRIFDLIDWVCFCGRTHIPGVFLDNVRRWDLRMGHGRRVTGDEVWHYHAPEELDYTWDLDDRKTIVNVGAVGQPRDGDARACYVLLDRYTVRWRRVDYDIDTTVRKIHAIPDLENFLGDRLRDGR